MRFHARLLPIAILVTVASSLTLAAQTTWHRIVDNEAGFTVSFPGKPTYQESTSPDTGLPLEAYSFYYNGDLLQVTFQPLVPAPRTPLEVNQVLSNSAEVYASKAGILLRQEKLPDGGRQFDNLMETKSGTLYMRTRLYVRQGGMVGLLYSSYDIDGIDEQISNQFFSSFSFFEPLQDRLSVSKRSASKSAKPKSVKRAAWYTLSGPSGDFIVSFPGKPNYLRLEVPGTDVPLHRYHYFFGENKFMVSFYDMKNNAEPGQALRRAAESYIAANPNWLVTRKEQLPDGSYKVEMRGVAEGFPIQTQTRLYRRNARIYYLTCHTKNLSGPNGPDVNRFFESFRLQ